LEVINTPTKSTVDESYIERRMIYCYRMKDAMDLMHKGKIADQLAIDFSLPVIFSVYCTRGKVFSPDYFKTEMMFLGVRLLSRQDKATVVTDFLDPSHGIVFLFPS
jgi:hypothetical protein